MEEPGHSSLNEPFECSVEVLAKIDSESIVEVMRHFFHNCPILLGFNWICTFQTSLFSSNFQVLPSQSHSSVSFPWQIMESLLLEMETCILGALVDKDIEKRSLSDVFFLCALSSNFIYGSFMTRFVLVPSSYLRLSLIYQILVLYYCILIFVQKLDL